MKKYLIIALSVSLLFAFFGCGSPKEDDAAKKEDPTTRPYGFDPDNYNQVNLTYAAGIDKAKPETGEINSKMHAITGEDFAKIKAAVKDGVLGVTYKADDDYAVGEVGWINKATAGPVIIGNGLGKKTGRLS